MKSGGTAAFGAGGLMRLARGGWVVGILFLCGCAASRRHLDNAILTRRPAERSTAARQATPYLLGCPDVVEVAVDGQTAPPAVCEVDLDGRIDLGQFGRVTVEGKTLAEAARAVAGQISLSQEQVRLHVREYKSQQIYLVGQVAGHQRTVPYQGPETVADLLRRIGGITPGAEAGNIRVVRARLPDGRPPEVFTVDLKAIYLRNDDQTNLVLEPFDRVYVGEMKRSSLGNCFPRWIRPVYEKLLGLRPTA